MKYYVFHKFDQFWSEMAKNEKHDFLKFTPVFARIGWNLDQILLTWFQVTEPFWKFWFSWFYTNFSHCIFFIFGQFSDETGQIFEKKVKSSYTLKNIDGLEQISYLPLAIQNYIDILNHTRSGLQISVLRTLFKWGQIKRTKRRPDENSLKVA